MSEVEQMPNPQNEPDDTMLGRNQGRGDRVDPDDVGPDGVDPDFEDPDDDNADNGESLDETIDWGGEDLEAAYLKAMSALDASDLELPPVEPPKPPREPRRDIDHESSELAPASPAAGSEVAGTESPTPSLETPVEPISDLIPVPLTTSSSQMSTAEAEVRLTPRQILEACLFVGGPPLNSKKLVSVLRGEYESEYADHEIDALNRQYAAECRPYEIRLGEGGYRMALRDEFERIRHKVYGLGPKEVRLSQEALEVLAVVAYHQPIKQAQVEALGKPGCGAVLRQLLRRELLAVERDPATPREVSYKTTPRFLSLFGIRNLDDLPRHEQVSYK